MFYHEWISQNYLHITFNQWLFWGKKGVISFKISQNNPTTPSLAGKTVKNWHFVTFCTASNSGWFPFHRSMGIFNTGQKRAESSRLKSWRAKGNVVGQFGQITFTSSQGRRKQPCMCTRNRNTSTLCSQILILKCYIVA